MNRTKRPKIPAPEGFYGCPQCEQVKPHSDFYAQPGGPHGHSSICKECKKAMKSVAQSRFTWSINEDIRRRFFANVGPPTATGCVEWTRMRNSYGYGQFYFNGRQLGAHRIAWALAGNELPKWPMVLDHTCRNRGCVNVEHMRVVSQRVNSTENSDSPHAKNAARTECINGHPFSDENTALMPYHPKGKRLTSTRACLICEPSKWRYAIIERQPPPGARIKAYGGWIGPFRLNRES